MKFANIYEEEYYFPYQEMSLEEAREYRYLISNSIEFINGKIIQMHLFKKDNFVYANGMFACSGNNKTFESRIVSTEFGFRIWSEVCSIKHRDSYSCNEEYVCGKDNIKIVSQVKDKVYERIIPYRNIDKLSK